MKSEPESLAMEGVRFFGEMSASISHEIKNVLAIVNENAGLLADLVQMSEKGIPLDPRRLCRVAASIARQVDRGDRIVRDMNRFAHSADMPRESVDLAEVVAFMPELAARLILMRGRMPEIRLPDTPVLVEANRFFLENLVWTCLCQAMVATEPDRAVSITVEADGATACVRFSGLATAALSDGSRIPDERQAMVAGLLNARVSVDTATGSLSILFAEPDSAVTEPRKNSIA